VALVSARGQAIASVLTRAMHGAKITAWGHAGIHASPSRFLKIVPYFFLISTCEESSLQMKHAKTL